MEVKVLEKLLKKFENGTLGIAENKLSQLQNKNIILYGAGNVGKRLYKNLRDNGVEISCFIDKNSDIDELAFEIPVYYPDDKKLDEFKQNSYIILSALFSIEVCSEIKLYLLNLGFKNVFSLHEVNLTEINNHAFYENSFDGSYNKIDILGKDKRKILEAFELLETEYDKRIYIDYLKSHLTMDFTQLEKPCELEFQYLAHDIDIEKNYSRLIDCGAFDGDTIRNLISKNIRIDSVAIFEPQNDLCTKIVNQTKGILKEINTVTVFPCGVHSETKKFRFSTSAEAPESGRIYEFGNDIIQCVAIDDVLKGFKPTFIKMDIEGAELEALKGAENTIKNYHPQLAICVYHALSDIWEIPLLIKRFYNGYKFYLRSYGYMGTETVLYAFPTK